MAVEAPRPVGLCSRRFAPQRALGVPEVRFVRAKTRSGVEGVVPPVGGLGPALPGHHPPELQSKQLTWPALFRKPEVYRIDNVLATLGPPAQAASSCGLITPARATYRCTGSPGSRRDALGCEVSIWSTSAVAGITDS